MGASNNAKVGNVAKLREALSQFCAYSAVVLSTGMFNREHLEALLNTAKSALAAPPRNCDRFGGDIDKLREACARERGLNPEEDLPDVFPDWLLALSTEKEGGKDAD